jgi:sugar phosphate isomerase/epimerase
MKVRAGAVILGLLAAACAGGSSPSIQEGRVPTPGLQLYSLRDEFKARGVPATLDLVKSFGITTVELAGTYGLPPAEFRGMLEARGLKAVSGHFPYDRWKKEPEAVALEAKALGLEFAGCAWANHKAPFDEPQCREVIDVFNRAGEATARHGVRFFYHFHGFEFRPHGEGTLADLMIAGCDRSKVSFQMDTLWVVLPGQDPARLLEKYPGRWVSSHLKDLRRGVPTGDLSGKTDVRHNVVLGTGQVDWPAFFRAAHRAGVKYHFIEDESPDAVRQIPQTLAFLADLRF